MAAILWALSIRAGGKQQELVIPGWVIAAARRNGPAPKSKSVANLDHLSALYGKWKEQGMVLTLRT